MKTITLLLLLMMLSLIVFYTGLPPLINGSDDMQIVCLDGVTYYLFMKKIGTMDDGDMEVKIARPRKVVPCLPKARN